jgi:P-type Mg2+ transporter
VLLEKDLGVLAEGIRQGRRVFANTLKYVRVTISANFGNMVSMATAAVVLPFLPLLPRQILLLNFLSDIPATTIAADRVDPETVLEPHGWDLTALRSFMVVFGLISSAFDLTTFAVLRVGLNAEADLFRTGWFIESTVTELAVMLVLRTKRRAWQSRPGTALLMSSFAVFAVTLALPFTPLAHDLGLEHPTGALLLSLAAITLGYITATEIAKQVTGRPAPATSQRA